MDKMIDIYPHIMGDINEDMVWIWYDNNDDWKTIRQWVQTIAILLESVLESYYK